MGLLRVTYGWVGPRAQLGVAPPTGVGSVLRGGDWEDTPIGRPTWGNWAGGGASVCHTPIGGAAWGREKDTPKEGVA